MPDPFERPAIAQSPLSAVLHAWNAGADLEEVVTAWVQYLETLARPFEVLLVDDCSTDGTSEQVDLLAQRYSSVRVLHHERHQGPGASLQTGVQAAQFPLLFTCPCDKQFHPPDLQSALETIDQVDLVTGYRVWKPLPLWLRAWDGLRRLVGRVLLGGAADPRECWLGWNGWRRRWAARWLFGVRVQDPECSYRLYRRSIFRRVPIQSRSSAAQIEILAKANHLECLMAEVPVSWVPPRNAARDTIEESAGLELRRLFFAPDFGPTILPEIPSPPFPEPTKEDPQQETVAP